jgi:hypothetical protein
MRLKLNDSEFALLKYLYDNGPTFFYKISGKGKLFPTATIYRVAETLELKGAVTCVLSGDVGPRGGRPHAKYAITERYKSIMELLLKADELAHQQLAKVWGR